MKNQNLNIQILKRLVLKSFILMANLLICVSLSSCNKDSGSGENKNPAPRERQGGDSSNQGGNNGGNGGTIETGGKDEPGRNGEGENHQNGEIPGCNSEVSMEPRTISIDAMMFLLVALSEKTKDMSVENISRCLDSKYSISYDGKLFTVTEKE